MINYFYGVEYNCHYEADVYMTALKVLVGIILINGSCVIYHWRANPKHTRRDQLMYIREYTHKYTDIYPGGFCFLVTMLVSYCYNKLPQT